MKQTTMRISTYLCVYFVAAVSIFSIVDAEQLTRGTRFGINDVDMFEIYRPGVYIVDLRKEANLNKKLTFMCSTGPNALDLNLTFTGINSKLTTIPPDQKYISGKKSVNLDLALPLIGEYTGRYNCTALYENNFVETISWYVYFYPGQEDLFLKCPLFGKIPKCLVFYRYKVPFRIPCRALHPAISVIEHTTNLYNFEYDPEQGFYGQLNTDVREFECRAFFDNKQDFQKYDLERKAYNTKISIEPPASSDLVPLGQNVNGLVAQRDHPLNLTCVAMVGCNDINYDIQFKTNTSDKYSVVTNVPDRTKCLVNYNEMSRFSKSLVINKLTCNSSIVSCEINYGTDLKTPSPNYMIYFAENTFLTPRSENPLIADYIGVTEKSSFLRLDAFFEASGATTIEWFLNKEKINTKPQTSDTSANKYDSECVHSGVFSYNCFLFIDFYNTKDVGTYEAVIRLKDSPETMLRLNISVIMPKSPDTFLILPKFCTQNWTCEIERTTALQCNAQAHRVEKMRIFKIDCSDLDDCYKKKTNQSYLQELLFDLLEEEEADNLDVESAAGHKSRLVEKQQLQDTTSSDLEQYEYDKDELTQPQLTPTTYDKLETLDSGLTWSVKSLFRVRQVHLIVCIAHNEIGDAIVARIIIPSALPRGRLADVTMLNERNRDREVVQGDNVDIEFNFNNIFYDIKNYKLNAKTECRQQNEQSLPDKYTHKVILKFAEVAAKCNYNYTLELTPNRHPYFTSVDSPLSVATRTVLAYNLDVQEPVEPYFLHPHTTGDASKQNHTILVSTSTNGTNTTRDTVVVATGDTLVVDSDRTIELRCDNYGRPKPIVSWFKDKQMLNLTEHKYKLVNGSSLKIFRTHQVDSGLYECSVYNRYGRISREFNVTVNQNTVFIKGMGKRHIFLIVVVSLLSLISLVLLAFVSVYLIKQKRENAMLKRKHEKLVDFLNGGTDLPDDIAEELLINSKLENLERLKFDDQKWEIDETRFLIHDKWRWVGKKSVPASLEECLESLRGINEFASRNCPQLIRYINEFEAIIQNCAAKPNE